VSRTAPRAIIALLMALFGLIGAAGSATADENPNVAYTTDLRDAAIHEVRASYSWQCLDVRAASTSEGAIIQRFDCNGKLHQRFYFTRTGVDTFGIGTLGRWCLGPQNSSFADETPIVTQSCLLGFGQHFRWVARGNGHYDIVEAWSGKCLVETGRRSPVVLRTCPAVAEPYPSLWTPLYHRQYNYSSVWG